MKIKHLLFSIFAAAGLLTGCLSEPEFEPVVEEGGIRINVDGGINQVATKVNADGFEHGDALGLYAVNYEDGNQTPGTLMAEGNQADHVKYIFDYDKWTWTPVKPVYYKDVNTNVDLYAFYPYAEPESVEAYTFEVKKDQSTAKTNTTLSGYEASDFLWTKVENVSPTEAKIKMRLDHKMAGVHVVLTEGEGFAEAGDWDLLDKKVLVTNTTRKATINMATGEVTPLGGAQATGIVMCPQTDGSFRAIVVPQTVQAGLQLFSITIGGQSYGFTKQEAFTYVPGRLNKFTIRVNRKYPSGEYELEFVDSEIVDWRQDINTHEGEARQYYCVNATEPGTLGRLIRDDKKNPDKIKNLKVSGRISAPDFYFMRDSMEILQSVNLKETKIISDGNSGEDVIPPFAFESKSTLVNFAFPESVVRIGNHAFDGCFFMSGALVLPDNLLEIGECAFAGCSNLSSLVLPMGLVSIGSQAFLGCRSLSGALQLPSTLKTIGSYAFAGDTNDTSFLYMAFTGMLRLPESLVEIGEGAFMYCSGFRGDIVIPNSVTVIENKIFYCCYGLNGVLKLHDGIKEIKGEMVSGVSVLYTGAFANCKFQGELVLPSELKEVPVGCFQGCNFTSIATLPQGLISIGDGAFSGNQRLMGVIEFPDELVSLGEGAFSSCSTLQGIVLPANLSLIKSSAFVGCSYINSIICKSSFPPIVQNNAFNGVPKDNFTVQVPANAVKKYQADSEWGEFKRIAAHYDFSISRNLFRTLNPSTSKTYVLRAPANHNWSVESKPDWITVTPSSGTGKTEVTVTIEELTTADVGTFEVEGFYDIYGSWVNPVYYNGRAGEIVYKLDDVEGYTTSMTVEQYDYEYSDGDVKVLNTATKGNGVNVVFLGDCYDARDIASGDYLKDLEEAIGYYFLIEPYNTYKDYFNVYVVFGESNDSGIGTVNTIRDAKFGSQYFLEGIAPDFDTCYEYADIAVEDMNPTQTLVVIVENTTEYGGICYMWGDGSAIACCPKSADTYPYDFRGIIQHEAGGHGFGKLADEYIYHNAFIQVCGCPCCNHLVDLLSGKALGWFRNLEVTGDMHQVGWSHLIFHPQYSDYVDMYEGGYFHSRGVYRSEAISCMCNNIPYFSAISRQAIVERIMEYAGEEFTLEKFYANDSDAFGPTTKGTNLPEIPLENFFNGKQHAPVYMGDSPNFKK